LNNAAAIVTPSQYSARRLYEIGIRPDLITVIPYGITMPEPPAKAEPRDGTRLVAVGRLVEKKAPITTLAAFARARQAMPALTLDIVGDGPLMPKARKFVATNSLTKAVTLHGALPNPQTLSILAEADIFVQHSVTDRSGDEEGLPVAILEAMARGLPVVATRHAGIPEAVVDGTTGLLVDEGDSHAMAQAILDLAASRGMRGSFGAAAAARARDRYTWERERGDLLRLLGACKPACLARG
jgi:glycosyltransferase involved in cell wall biosynthesis